MLSFSNDKFRAIASMGLNRSSSTWHCFHLGLIAVCLGEGPLSNIPDLYLSLDANSKPPSSVTTIKNVFRQCQMSLGAKSLLH